jgi:transcriptional regulator GlxA family with amidase domain
MGANDSADKPTETELAFVRKSYNDCSAFLAICGGVAIPLQAGILEGKTATGPRFLLNAMRQMAPNTDWVEKRYVQDGKLWTSGTLLNGTDMMLAFAKSVWGKRGADVGAINVVENAGRLGAWPARDIDFKDVPWAI